MPVLELEAPFLSAQFGVLLFAVAVDPSLVAPVSRVVVKPADRALPLSGLSTHYKRASF